MRLAIGQTNIKSEDKEWNLENTVNMVRQASKKDVDIIFFPEMSFTGFSMNTKLTKEKNNETLTAIKKVTNKYKIAIAFGWVKSAYNTAENHYTIIDKSGMVISDYTKIHLFTFANEDRYFRSGNRISTCSMEGLSFSTFICYDLRFPEIFQAASEKVSIIVVAANWPSSRINHWKCLLKARALENQCYIIGVNCVGVQKNYNYSGSSCVFNPNGELIIEGFEKEELIIFDIYQDVKEYRKKFPTKKDRRTEFYKRLL